MARGARSGIEANREHDLTIDDCDGGDVSKALETPEAVRKQTMAVARSRMLKNAWGFDTSTLDIPQLRAKLFERGCTIATSERSGDFTVTSSKQSLLHLLHSKLPVPSPHTRVADFLKEVTAKSQSEGDTAVLDMARGARSGIAMNEEHELTIDDCGNDDLLPLSEALQTPEAVRKKTTFAARHHALKTEKQTTVKLQSEGDTAVLDMAHGAKLGIEMNKEHELTIDDCDNDDLLHLSEALHTPEAVRKKTTFAARYRASKTGKQATVKLQSEGDKSVLDMAHGAKLGIETNEHELTIVTIDDCDNDDLFQSSAASHTPEAMRKRATFAARYSALKKKKEVTLKSHSVGDKAVLDMAHGAKLRIETDDNIS